MTEQLIENVMRSFVTEVKKEYKDKLKSIYLFGSCARKDYDAESDIDVMILLDVSETELESARRQIYPIISKLDEEYNYDILLSPIIQRESTYKTFLSSVPFYQAIKNEGIKYV